MSRSKAATKNKLESASKTESSGTTNDTQMADEGDLSASQTLNPPSSMDGSRKRGRDMSSMADEDDAESSAREEDRKATDQSNEVPATQHPLAEKTSADQDMDYRHDSLQSTSQMDPAAMASEDVREQDHATIGRIDADQDSSAQCEEEASASLTVVEGESRKLSLSYVLG